ncbi:MAG: hypothetical protein KBT47_05715 [Armatimonadetes bacterium]|nr:hypothetical protein [Candidatus Hippobium faecium]
MKKLLLLLVIVMSACTLFAEDTYELSLKFKEKETVKNFSKLIINGEVTLIDKLLPYQSEFEGIMTEKTLEITKEKTAKKYITYNIKDIKTTNEKTSEIVKPKSIGLEMTAKGKITNFIDQKGKVTQKLENTADMFPEKAIKVGDTWECGYTSSGITLPAKSTLKEIKEIDKVKYAVINTVIDTPIDVNALMKLMNVSSTTLGAYDQMEMAAYCKGNSEMLFDIEKGTVKEEKFVSTLYLEGYMYGMTVAQGQYNINYEQKAFTAEDYKKYAEK